MPNLIDTVYRQIRAELASGRWRGGERLPELQLAAELNVSRNPVREALVRLAAEGVLERSPGSGCRVPVRDNQWLVDMYQFREVLEGMAARLAARRITRVQLMRLEEESILFERLAAELTDEEYLVRSEESREIDRQFHFKLVEFSGNRALLDAWQQQQVKVLSWFDLDVAQLLDRAAARGASGSSEAKRLFLEADRAAVGEHARIVQAIRDGDPDQAETAARRHISVALARIIEVSQLLPDKK